MGKDDVADIREKQACCISLLGKDDEILNG